MAGAFQWDGPSPMGLASYVQQQGQMGKQQGEDSRLARLVSGAMADPASRQSKLAEIASFRPEAAFAAQGQFDQQDAARNKRLGEIATIYLGAGSQKANVLRQFAPELTRFGMQIPPDIAPSPEIDELAQQLAQVYGGMGQAGGTKIHSQRVLADGRILNTYADGRTEVTDHIADRQSWFANNEGVDPYIVEEGGGVRMVGPGGGQQPQPQVAPQRSPDPVGSGQPIGGAVVNGGTGQADPTIAALPPDQQQAAFRFMAMGRPFHIKGGQVIEGMSAGSSAPQPAPAPAQGDISRVPINALGGGPINPLRRPSKPEAGAAPPSGYRYMPDGSLQFIPGGPADPANKPQAQDKPIPVGALRLQLEAEEALTGAEGVIDELDRIDQQLKSGALDLGFFSNLANKAKNFAGMSDEESRAYGAFTSTLERLRNESLRLNKGVQTEGDSQRAWNELIADINDGKNVQTQIERIQRYNRRAVELQQRKMQAVQQNYQGKAAADSPEDDIDALLAEFGN